MVVKEARQERGGATREALVAAARGLFGRQGFAATSLDDVAAAAGVTKGALYHHFSDKEDLFRAVVESVRSEVTQRLSEHFLALDEFRALEVGCLAILDAYLDPEFRQIVSVDARSVLSTRAYIELQSRYETVFLRAALRRAMRLGVIEPQPLRALTTILTGAIVEGCALVADADDHEAARAEVSQVILWLLARMRVAAPDGAGPSPG